MSFSSSVDLGGHLIDVRVGIHVLPEGFSVLWIISTGIVLFRAVVVEWNTSCSQSECETRFESAIVVELILESSVIVIVNEDTEGINILEFTIFFSKSVFDTVHAFSRSKYVLDGVVHWIIEKTVQILLIWSNVAWVTVEALSHLEDSGRLSVLSPEITFDFWYCVDSNTIELIGVDQVFNPGFKISSNILVILVKIWKISESAVFNLVCVIPVVDLAV